MDRIRFKINRKRRFKGSLLRWSVFVNGKPSPQIKNGGSAEVSVKRENVVFVQTEGSIGNNAVIFTSSEEQIGVDIRCVGSLKNGYRLVFCPEGSDTPYQSVSFDRLLSGLEGQGTLNEAQRKLALLAFVMESFDTEEVLRSKHAGEIVPTLKDLGADLYASTLERAITSQLSGFSLPIEGGEDDEAMAERFRKVEETVLEADENYRLTEELSRTAANYISAHYYELFTESDLYRFDGADDPRCIGNTMSGRREKPKDKLGRKQIFKLALASLIFLTVLFVMFALWRKGAYYPARAALENNSHTVTVNDPEIAIEHGYGKYESDKILISADGETYTMDWANKPNSVGRDAEEFVKKIDEESSLTLVVKDDDRVCAVSGEETTYMSVEEFNGYQKTQAITGTALLAFFSLLTIIVFAAVVLVIIWSDKKN